MPTPSDADSLSALCEHAKAVADRSHFHQAHIETFAAGAERELLSARADLAQALELPGATVDAVQTLLRVHVQRREDGAESARRLLLDARDQHDAVAALLSHLEIAREHKRLDRDAPVRRNAVLVVDDHEAVCDLAALVLRRAGFEVRTAGNGVQALIVAHEMRPVVIIMDLNMPVLDGLQATRLLKATDTTRHARVIAHTGDPEFDPHAKDLFAAVILKPSAPEEVVRTVRQVASL